jgi:hypothetical protein
MSNTTRKANKNANLERRGTQRKELQRSTCLLGGVERERIASEWTMRLKNPITSSRLILEKSMRLMMMKRIQRSMPTIQIVTYLLSFTFSQL